MKLAIKYLPLWIMWLGVAMFSSHHVLYKEKLIYKQYNGMKGIITWATFAPRSGIYICGVRLDNGLYGSVNYGSNPVRVGDSFTNNMYYSPIFGLTGTAYCVLPKETENLWISVVYIMSVIIPAIMGLLYLIISLITLWIKNH